MEDGGRMAAELCDLQQAASLHVAVVVDRSTAAHKMFSLLVLQEVSLQLKTSIKSDLPSSGIQSKKWHVLTQLLCNLS